MAISETILYDDIYIYIYMLTHGKGAEHFSEGL